MFKEFYDFTIAARRMPHDQSSLKCVEDRGMSIKYNFKCVNIWNIHNIQRSSSTHETWETSSIYIRLISVNYTVLRCY